MIEEIEIRLSDPLPPHHQWLTRTKEAAERLAERLHQVNSPYAERVEHCADVAKFWSFQGGYTRLKSVWFCRVRGCPVCERSEKKIRFGKLGYVLKAAKKSDLGRFQAVSFFLPPHPVDRSRDYLQRASRAIEQISKLTLFSRIKGYACLMQTEVVGETALISCHLVLVATSSFFSGRHYVKRTIWQQIWDERIGESTPPVEICKADKDINTIFGVIHRACHLNLETVDNTALSRTINAFHRVKFIRFAGVLKTLLASQKSRTLYPADKKRLNNSEVDCFVFAPNPWTLDESDEFLKVSHLPDDEIDELDWVGQVDP